MDGYPVDDGKLATLAASRSGRVALAGFEYQRAFAVLRLAALMLRQSVPGCADVPRLLRYEWAEDIDELCMDDRIVLWQCKHGDDWHSPAPLAEVLVGFAPKWLWTPADQRHRLAFRLVTSDRAFAAHHDVPAPLPRDDGLRDAFLRHLKEPPGPRTDRARWQAEADAAGHAVLFEALCQATQVAYQPGLSVTDPRLWTAEQRAVDALAKARRVADPGLAAEIAGALRLLLDVHATHAPAPDGTIGRSGHAPRWLHPYEVEHRLHPFAPGPASARPDLVDRPRLQQLLTLPRGLPYVARRPEWSDVVRGADTGLCFLERVHTEALERRLREALTGSLSREGGLRFLPVLGAPGAGKSTLALRVAAKLVLEGHCVAVDLRHPLDREEDSTALVDALRTLGEGAQPVLLVLDDPLDIDSGWPRLLQTLARHRGAVVALAATPAFLYDRHQNELRAPVQKLDPITLPPPDRDERRSLATLYPEADAQWILDSEEELLVLTMRAAANKSFKAIIEGLWRTLADGRPIPSDALGASLPWPVAAFALVCWFHRAYVPCPLPLLQAFLAQRPDVGADAGERLRTMTLKQGWRIFQLQDWQGDRRYAYQGGSVTTMHARVAQRAWELRPAPGWDLGRIVATCSATCPVIARQLGAALVGVHRQAPDEAEHVLAEMARPWADATNAVIETRYLHELAASLGLNRHPLPGWLPALLLQRATAVTADSWLAALTLHYASHQVPKLRRFADAIAIPALIEAGDFSIAPARASIFATAFGQSGALTEQFIQRLWAALEGELPWRLDSSLLTWLLAHDDDKPRVRRHLRSVHRWLDENSGGTDVRAKLIGLLGELNPADHVEAIRDLLKWLKEHPEDAHVRTKFIDILGKLNPTDRADAIRDLKQWLKDHPGDSSVRTKFIGFLGALKPTDRADAITDLRQWLNDHPDDTSVRTRFIGLLGEMNPTDRADAITDLRQWLKDHPGDSSVRTKFIGLLGELKPSDRADAITDLRQWLKDHPDDTTVRTRFIGLLGELMLDELGPGEAAAAVSELRDWLHAHQEDSAVRAAFLSSDSARQGLLEPPDVDEGMRWLARQPQDANVRTSLISLLLYGNDPRLPRLLEEALAIVDQSVHAYPYCSTALKACASLPPEWMGLTCDWLDWASAALSGRHGDRSAQTIATSTLQAGSALKRHLADGSAPRDALLRARRTLSTLEAALDTWYASVGQPPVPPR